MVLPKEPLEQMFSIYARQIWRIWDENRDENRDSYLEVIAELFLGKEGISF